MRVQFSGSGVPSCETSGLREKQLRLRALIKLIPNTFICFLLIYPCNLMKTIRLVVNIRIFVNSQIRGRSVTELDNFNILQ